MSKNLFSLIVALSLMAGCAPAASTATPPPAVTSTATATATPDPVAHTACAEGVDLTGQTVSFYHILDPYAQVDTVYNPLRAG